MDIWGLLLQLAGVQPQKPLVSPQPFPSAMVSPTTISTPRLQNKTASPSAFSRVSYYLPTGNQTATGTIPKSGYTAAISPDLLPYFPFGTTLKLPMGQTVRIEDLTAPHIKNTLDLFYDKNPGFGLMRNTPFEVTGRNTEGLRYKIR